MYTTNAQAPGVNGTTAAAINMQAGGMAVQGRAQTYSSLQGSLPQTPWWLLGIVGLYLIWALVIQHERIKESLQPANIAANLHNWVVITVAAVGGIVLGKVLFTKLAALGIPGAAQLAQVFGAA